MKYLFPITGLPLAGMAGGSFAHQFGWWGLVLAVVIGLWVGVTSAFAMEYMETIR